MKRLPKQLTENEILNLYSNNQNLTKSDLYCKKCGKLIIYTNADLHKSKDNKLSSKHGLTFLSTRIYNNHEYRLCYCEDCVKHEFNTVTLNLTCKFSQQTKFAFDVNEKDFTDYTHKRQALTKNKMIEKYGEEVGLQKWNNYCQKQSVTNTFEYKQEKYGMCKQDFVVYNKSRASTKELFIKRHGLEKGTKLWNEYCERQRYTTSLEYFIEKYGKNIGTEKYDNFEHARTTFGGTSKIADKFFKELINDSIFDNHEIYFNNHPKEYCIDGYRLDFYDKTINLVIEFYGDLWHANPKKFGANDSFVHPFTKKITNPQDIWNKDNLRKNNIINKIGCEFIIVWESDVKKSTKKLNKTKNNIIDIIKKKYS